MITDWNSSEHMAFNVNFPCQISASFVSKENSCLSNPSIELE